MDRIPNGTIVTGTREDIAGHRHEITGYEPGSGLYRAEYIPPLRPRGDRLERQLFRHEFAVEEVSR